MVSFVVRRLLLSVPTLFGVTMVIFLMASLAGDPEIADGLEAGASQRRPVEERARLARLLRTDLPPLLNTSPRDHARVAGEAILQQRLFWTRFESRVRDRLTPTQGTNAPVVAAHVSELVVSAVAASPLLPEEDISSLVPPEVLTAEDRATLGSLLREALETWQQLAALFGRGAWAIIQMPDLGSDSTAPQRVLLAAASAAARTPLMTVEELSAHIRELLAGGASRVSKAVRRWRVEVEASATPEQRADAAQRLLPEGGLAATAMIEELSTAKGATFVAGLAWLEQAAGLTVDSGLVSALARGALELDSTRERRLRRQLASLWETKALEHRSVEGVLDHLTVAVGETRYAHWLMRFLRLDFGESLFRERPVKDLILERLPVTLGLQGLALVVTYFVSVLLGSWSALSPRSRGARCVEFLLALLYALPSFVLGSLAMANLGGIVPISGLRTPALRDALERGERLWWEPAIFADLLAHVALPLFVLTAGGVFVLSRYARTGIMETSGQDFIFAAKSRGLAPTTVFLKHVLRVGLLPLVSLLAVMLPWLVSGSVIVESIFDINGLGRLAVDAALARDVPLAMGMLTLAAVVTLLGYIATDVLLAWLDPRSRPS